ncbi:MAG: lysine--tRNA ligase [Candidatus Omnitrophota bacterium]
MRADRLCCLSKSLRPMPEKWHGLKDVEVRYRQRYLDLASNQNSRDLFKKRSLIIRQIRHFLDERGYLEVETPMMHPIPGGAAGKPFKTHHEALDMDLYLRVAPELYLKKLLVGGFERVYEINKSFRNEGISTRHNPEFTMIEVYTAYHDVTDVMELTENLIRHAAQSVLGTLTIQGPDHTLDLTSFERISFAKLMKDSFGISPEEELSDWVQKLKAKGIKIEGKDLSRSQLINLVADLIEPGKISGAQSVIRPIFVTDYFAELSPLARRSVANPHLSDRFELYIGGMEIANGYSEQNNPIEQRLRFEEELGEKTQRTKADAIDEDFLLALEHGMPPAGGLGIGIDRLVMTLTHQASIREVVLFPQMKKESV